MMFMCRLGYVVGRADFKATYFRLQLFLTFRLSNTLTKILVARSVLRTPDMHLHRLALNDKRLQE